MTGFRFVVLVLCFCIVQVTLCSQEWEPSDIKKPAQALARELGSDNPTITFTKQILSIYQSDISDKTIHRCMFYTSCSQFALKSVERFGFVFGVVVFLDRYCIRENQYAYEYYTLKKNAYGTYRLDDDFFLRSEE